MTQDRSSSFCPTVHRLLKNHLARERKKGKSDLQIIKDLRESCPEIGLDTWYKRFRHIDTCLSFGVDPECLTQTETRKVHKFSERDRKRVKQSFNALIKNHVRNNGDTLQPKEVRRKFREAMRNVNPTILVNKPSVTVAEEAAPQASSNTGTIRVPPNALRTPMKIRGEKPPLLLSEGKLTGGSKYSEAVDFSRLFPSDVCRCRGCKVEFCEMREDWRAKQMRLHS